MVPNGLVQRFQEGVSHRLRIPKLSVKRCFNYFPRGLDRISRQIKEINV